VIVLNLINTNGEYILASFVTEQAHALTGLDKLQTKIQTENYITQFYSQYLFLTTSISFLIQLFLVHRIFERIGIRGALHVLPLIMIASYSLIALLPILLVARTTMVIENSVNYSLQITTRHALFLPVVREEKYVGKHTIDTFFFRVGDVLSGSFVYLASSIVGLGIVGFVVLNIALASVLLWLSRTIGTRHDNSAREVMANMPPVVGAALDDVSIPAGQLSQMQLAADTFIDPDVGDALRYEAFTGHSDRLPAWIKFDPLSRNFRFNPPASCKGEVRIRVVARDYEGLEAELSFKLSYGTK